MPLRAVLVTGCSEGGIGAALALAVARRGHHVFATARNTSKIPGELSALSNATVLQLDITSASSVAEAAEAVVSSGRGLNVLINNAGAGYAAPILDLDVEKAQRLYDTNVWAYAAIETIIAGWASGESKPKGTTAEQLADQLVGDLVGDGKSGLVWKGPNASAIRFATEWFPDSLMVSWTGTAHVILYQAVRYRLGGLVAVALVGDVTNTQALQNQLMSQNQGLHELSEKGLQGQVVVPEDPDSTMAVKSSRSIETPASWYSFRHGGHQEVQLFETVCRGLPQALPEYEDIARSRAERISARKTLIFKYPSSSWSGTDFRSFKACRDPTLMGRIIYNSMTGSYLRNPDLLKRSSVVTPFLLRHDYFRAKKHESSSK